MITGDDGGVWYSYDSGNNWWKANNLPISQFYHVSVDMADPYHVYGGLQDNSVWIGDSAYPGGISNSRWENLCGGDGFWAFPDPADRDYAYVESQGGEIARVNRITLEGRSIKPQPNYGEGKLRFNWNTPIHMSPNEPGTVYIGAQFLFRSRDHGQTWDRISPDLTTNDPEKQKQEESGGVTVDNSDAEMHTTIYSISESPRDGQTIWVGTDDGNLQVTRDGGKILDQRGGQCARSAQFFLGLVGGGQPLRRGHGLRHFRPPHLRRHGPLRLQDHRLRQDLDAARGHGSGVRGYAHVIKEDTVVAEPVVPRHRVRSLDFARRRQAVGAVQGRRISQRRRARHGGASARIRPGAGHARPRHLDRRRHHARCASSLPRCWRRTRCLCRPVRHSSV